MSWTGHLLDEADLTFWKKKKKWWGSKWAFEANTRDFPEERQKNRNNSF